VPSGIAPSATPQERQEQRGDPLTLLAGLPSRPAEPASGPAWRR
jgi:hypothetical protein